MTRPRARGLFVPKPSTDAHCQRRSIPGLGQTVRGRPLASTAVEIGTFTGYSALAVARGLGPGGRSAAL